jgi:hypothetical protein
MAAVVVGVTLSLTKISILKGPLNNTNLHNINKRLNSILQ